MANWPTKLSIKPLNTVSTRNATSRLKLNLMFWKVREAIKANIAHSIIDPLGTNPPKIH